MIRIRNKYGVPVASKVENKFRIRVSFTSAIRTGIPADHSVIQTTFLQSTNFNYTFKPVEVGNYNFVVYVDSIKGLSLVHAKNIDSRFSSVVVLQRSNQPLSE
jgi:hypothetical protein